MLRSQWGWKFLGHLRELAIHRLVSSINCSALVAIERQGLNLQSVRLSGKVPFELLKLALTVREFSVASQTQSFRSHPYKSGRKWLAQMLPNSCTVYLDMCWTDRDRQAFITWCVLCRTHLSKTSALSVFLRTSWFMECMEAGIFARFCSDWWTQLSVSWCLGGPSKATHCPWQKLSSADLRFATDWSSLHQVWLYPLFVLLCVFVLFSSVNTSFSSPFYFLNEKKLFFLSLKLKVKEIRNVNK